MSLDKVKKGNKVILHLFTGVGIGIKEVIKADKEYIYIDIKDVCTKFSRETGKQLDLPPKQKRFANYITVDDGSFVPAKSKSNAAPKARAMPKPEPEIIDGKPFIESEYIDVFQ